MSRCLVLLALLAALAACGPAAEPPAAATAHGHADGHESAPEHTRIPAAVAARSGIEVAPAGPGIIAREHEVQGLVLPLESRVARVTGRFPGPVRKLHVRVGDRVAAGAPLALIESNRSLSTYVVRAPIAGTVTARGATLGAMAGAGDTLFEITDLAVLRLHLHLFGEDLREVGPGTPVRIVRLSDGAGAETEVERILPGVASASQSTIARATLDNADGLWRPGGAVSARLQLGRTEVALRVPLSALQTIDGQPVVFVRAGDDYTARPVVPGLRDAAQVEIRAGIAPGEEVVVAQSYLVKADLLKAGAAHEH